MEHVSPPQASSSGAYVWAYPGAGRPRPKDAELDKKACGNGIEDDIASALTGNHLLIKVAESPGTISRYLDANRARFVARLPRGAAFFGVVSK